MFVLKKLEYIPLIVGVLLIIIGVVIHQRYVDYYQMDHFNAIGSGIQGTGGLAVVFAAMCWLGRLNLWLKEN